MRALIDAAKAVLQWADDLKPYADDGSTVVPVFERLREALQKTDAMCPHCGRSDDKPEFFVCGVGGCPLGGDL